MNERFYELPEEKRKSIIEAGFRVFSKNSYKKSPMCEIAGAAHISKSLLFHYFHNKRELYLFLWEEGARFTIEYLNQYGCYEPAAGLFEMMKRGMEAKLALMRQYPDMTAFVLRAFFERDPEVAGEIEKSYEKHIGARAAEVLFQIDPAKLKPGLDVGMMYQEMYWASKGYLWEAMQRESLDADGLEQDFEKLFAFWKSVYGRERAEEDG
ncbi:MAG: TetR/AcrR family transcriptional regulator [Lachnospiraceae bacterium]|nr:TetR/AcrR family transcriptional regulator [Lachnospiraceae bacterium]